MADTNTEIKEDENYTESNFQKNIRAIFNRIKISNFISLMVIITMIVVFSLWSVGWDPNRIGWEKFLVNLAFLLFLGIYGLFFGESTGINYFKTLVTGLYQATREKFVEQVDKIIEKGYGNALPEYITWRYQKDYKAECNRRLLGVRIFNNRVLELSNEEIEQLHNEPIEKVWSENSPYPNRIEHFSRLSDPQYETVKSIITGEIKIDYIDDYNFFLTDTKSTDEPFVKRIKSAEKRKMKMTWSNRISKLSLIFLFALIGAGIGTDKATGQDGAQTILNLVQRLSVLTTTIVCGFNTARLLNNEDVEVLKFKTSYLSVFYATMENKQFHFDYEEKAKQEYDAYKILKESEDK